VTGPAVKAPVEVAFKATGVEGVRRGIRMVQSEGTDGHEKLAKGARGAASALAEISHTAALSQGSIKELIKSGAEMALMFGIGGPLATAFGFLGLSIFNVFTHARDQIEQTARTAREETARLVESKDIVGLSKVMQRKFSGERHAVQKEDE
jgi:hypothetical protein